MRTFKLNNIFRGTGFAMFLLMVLTIVDARAQNSQVLYFMNLPQGHNMNPALRSTNKVYIGLPVISGTAISLNNNFMNFSDVIMKGRKDSLITFLHPDYDFSKFLSKIRDKNSIEPEFMTQILGIGFTLGESYIFLDINTRISGNFVIPGDLIKLGLQGNTGFVGGSADFSSMRADAKIFNEIGFGFSKNYSDKLRIGIKAKALLGVFAANMDNRDLSISVDNSYSHTLTADITYNFSAPHLPIKDVNSFVPSFEFNDSAIDGSYFSGLNNMGFGLDLGFTYDLTKKIKVSGALTDLGFIKWKRDVQNQRVKGQYTFSGLDLTDVLSGNKDISQVADAITDSLNKHFTPKNTAVPFTTYLPYNLTLAGSYNLTKNVKLGVLSNSRFVGKQMKQTLTLSANVNLLNALQTTITYTAANHRYDNIGAGLALRLGWIQLYAMTDRIPLAFNKILSDGGKSSIVLPASWNTIDFRFGMNYVFGNKVRGEGAGD